MAPFLINGYRNLMGEHCGSTAMRNLLFHYTGLDLAEAEVFGLGSGIDGMYLESEGVEPAILAFGRGVTMEMDVGAALGVDYREQPDPDDARAWEAVRNEVLAGRPTMLSGDSHYLDYRGFEGHFPSHRFVLIGLDDDEQTAWIMDRRSPDPQPCSYASLAKSRNPPDFVSTYNLWGKFHGTTVANDMETALATALAKTAARMLGQDTSQCDLVRMMAGGRTVRAASGLRGLARYRDELPGWRERDDAAVIAGYASRCIEKYGTGGGNFRTMFAVFLGRARTLIPDCVPRDLPELAARSSAKWTLLAEALERAATGGDGDAWDACSAILSEILELEARLFELLGESTA